jgi:5,10-methylenetetrahydromethanopterin reductase
MGQGRQPFDFAFIPAGPVEETLDLIRLGERLGYRCAWIPDQGFHRDPFVLLGLAARETREIGLGLGVTSPFTRHPVQIARAAGVLDEVTGGRFRLGLGTANVAHVLRPLGLDARRAVQRLRDAIIINRGLLRGEVVQHDGVAEVVRGVKLEFTPVRAEVPLYLGTRGPRTIELVGELADGILVESLFNADGPPYVMRHLDAGCRRAGRPREAIDVVAWQVVQITDAPEAAIQTQRPWIARSIKVGPKEALLRIGIPEAVIDAVVMAVDRGDAREAVAQVTDDAVRSLTVIGDVAYVAGRVREMFERGATAVSLLLLGPPEAIRHTLHEFASRVMPMVGRPRG